MCVCKGVRKGVRKCVRKGVRKGVRKCVCKGVRVCIQFTKLQKVQTISKNKICIMEVIDTIK